MQKINIGIVGLHQSGKSLLINCLLKRSISKVGTGSATTHAPVYYSFSEVEYAEYFDTTGCHEITPEEVAKYDNRDYVVRINVYLNNNILKAFSLIDLPGTGFNVIDNSTMSNVLSDLDFAILLATDVKEYTSASSFYTNTLKLLQCYNISYYFFLNCTKINKWSPNNKQNIELAESDLELLQIFEPLPVGEYGERPLLNLMWYWCSCVDSSDELYSKYYEAIREYFAQRGKELNRQNLENASKFYLVESIFDKKNRLYLELKRDFRKEINKVKRELCPIGTIQAFAFNRIPYGWMMCDGRKLDPSVHQDLFNAIGVTFGGDGEKTFAIPDLRGQFIRGWDELGNVDPDSKRKFGSVQEDALQGHGHLTNSVNSETTGGHTHKVYYTVYKVGSNIGKNDMPVYEIPSSYSSSHSYGGDPGTNYSGSHSHQIPELKANEMISTKYGVTKVDIETRPINTALIYCIKVNSSIIGGEVYDEHSDSSAKESCNNSDTKIISDYESIEDRETPINPELDYQDIISRR